MYFLQYVVCLFNKKEGIKDALEASERGGTMLHTTNVKKAIIALLVLTIFVTASISFGSGVKVEALNSNRTKFDTLSLGKENGSYSLTKDIDTIAYDFEIKSDSKITFEASAEKVTGDVVFSVTYNSTDSSSLIKETEKPSGEKISWEHKSKGLFKPGKYYLLISGENSSVTSGKFKVKVSAEKITIHDNNKNDYSASAQRQPYDGSIRTYYFSSHRSYGLDEDYVDWLYFDATGKGSYIKFEPLNKFRGQVDIELFEETKSGLKSLYTYNTTETKEISLRDLPEKTYYLKIRWNEMSSTEKTYENSQVIYNLLVASYTEIKSVSMAKSKISLGLKGAVSKADIELKLNPESVYIKQIAWKSSDNKVVTVVDGSLKAVGKGSATITCTVTGLVGGPQTCKCQVDVKAQTVKLNKSSLSLEKGKTATLSATVSPKESVVWKSDNTAVAKVSSKGVVTAVKAGKANVYATSKSGIKSSKCTVEVKDPPKPKPTPTPTVTPTPKPDNSDSKTAEVVLSVSQPTLDVGFKTTVTKVSGPSGGTWSVSGAIELYKNDGNSVVVRGLREGIGTVTYSVSGTKKTVSISVVE